MSRAPTGSPRRRVVTLSSGETAMPHAGFDPSTGEFMMNDSKPPAGDSTYHSTHHST
jgi:hypothetical protein